MATHLQKIGMIMRAGLGFDARAIGQGAQHCPNEGAAREYFRRFAGYAPQAGYGQVLTRTSGSVSVVFVPDVNRAGITDVYLQIPGAAPVPPEPPPVPPDPTHVVAYASRSGVYWQDLAKTILATNVGDPVRVWEVPGGDLVLHTGTPGTLAQGGGVTFPQGGTTYRSVLSAGAVFSLYCSINPEPGVAGANIAIASAGAELGTFLQPRANNNVLGVGLGGSFDITLPDTPFEEVRGLIANGASATWFSGTVSGSGSLAVGSIAGLQLGCTQMTWWFRGTIRAVLLYNVAHDASTRNEVVTFLNTANVTTCYLDVVTACHFEGDGGLTGASATDMLAFQAAYPTTPVTLCMAPQDFFLGTPAVDVAAAYQALQRPIDENAIHTHGQVEWITAAGVTPRLIQTFQSAVVAGTGYFVIMSSYTQGELTTMMDFAADLFVTNGFFRPRTWLAGGYMYNAAGRAALVASGYTRDLSQVPPVLTDPIYTSAGFPNLVAKIDTEYVAVTVTSQPTLEAGLTRIPSNDSVINYNSLAINEDVLNRNIQAARGGTAKVFVAAAHFGTMMLLDPLYDAMIAYAAAHKVTLRFQRAKDISAAA